MLRLGFRAFGIVVLTTAMVRSQISLTIVPLDSVRAGSRTVLQIEVAIGSQDLLPGDQVAVQLPPFWQRPQVIRPDSAAFVLVTFGSPAYRVNSAVEGISIDGFASTTEVATVRATVLDRVPSGSHVTFRFGTLPSANLGIRASRIAGSERVVAQLVRLGPNAAAVESSTALIQVEPGPAARILVRLDPIAADGENVRVRVSILDSFSNRATGTSHDFEIVRSDGASYGNFTARNGYFESKVWLGSVGTDSVTVVLANGLRGTSNPAIVRQTAPLRIWWGDSHTHCAFSGHGAGTPIDLLRYARWTALLDWVVYSEHDWIQPNHQTYSASIVNQHYESGSFVPFQGLEWTARTPPSTAGHYGHLTVVGRDGRMITDLNADRFRTPIDVFGAAASQNYMLIVNHPLGRYSYDWSYFEPGLVRNVEMVSDATLGLRSNEFPSVGRFGRSVSSVIQDGYVVGFVGVSDNHFSQPGISTANVRKTSGLTAVLAPELTRGAIFDALFARHNYATTGARIILEVKSQNAIMGDVVRIGTLPGRRFPLDFSVIGEQQLELVEVIKNGTTLRVYTNIQGKFFSGSLVDSVSSLPSSYYVRVRQLDQEMAWSSPIWVWEDPRSPPPGADTNGEKIRSLQSNPNPSFRTFKISFNLAESGPTQLSIFDILGRKIKTLISDHLSAGDHVAWWTGETNEGFVASSGLYFARLELMGSVSSIRLMMIR